MNKHGQAGIEALMIMGILVVLLAVAYSLYTLKSHDLGQSKEYLKERGECLTLVATMGNIFTLGNSAQMTLQLRNTFTVSPTAQHIESAHAFCTVPFSTIKGPSGSSPFNVTGKILIQNQQDTVLISLLP